MPGKAWRLEAITHCWWRRGQVPGSHTTISGFRMMAMFMMMTMMIQMGRGLHYSFAHVDHGSGHGIGYGAGYGIGQLIIGVDGLKTQSQL